MAGERRAEGEPRANPAAVTAETKFRADATLDNRRDLPAAGLGPRRQSLLRVRSQARFAIGC